jgi:hypothetical protein
LNVWKKLRQLFRPTAEDQDFISMVILVRQPRDLPEDVVRGAAERAWKCKFGGSEQNPNFIMQKIRHSVVRAEGHFMTAANSANPYGDNPAKAEQIKDLQCRKALREQRAFISLDYIRSVLPISPQEKYAVLAKLAAELLADECTGICFSGERKIIPAHADLENQLQNLSTLEELCT